MLLLAILYVYFNWEHSSELKKCSKEGRGYIAEISKQRNKGDLA